MDIIGRMSELINSDSSDPYQPPIEESFVYNLLKCPSCLKNNIITYYWMDGWHETEDDINYDILYPSVKNVPLGLPEKVLSTYKAAQKVKTIDINAYAILLRRLLEIVCIDRNASGDSLYKMLKDLSDRNEIPEKLVKVAMGLKDFGNIGAHASIGEISEKEIPIITSLCDGLLEYIYTAPYIATIAEERLKNIKSKNDE